MLRARLPWRVASPFASVGGSQKGPTLGEPFAHPPETAPGVLLMALPPGNCDPYRYRGIPGTISGRMSGSAPFDKRKKFPSRIGTGRAVCAWMMLCRDHPRVIGLRMLTFAPGTVYVIPVEKA